MCKKMIDLAEYNAFFPRKEIKNKFRSTRRLFCKNPTSNF